jgi:tetratricopeptide (TPR) repeat protein
LPNSPFWGKIRPDFGVNKKEESAVSQTKQKKDEYQKALTAYGQAVKEFRKGEMGKAAEAFTAFIEKYPEDKEIVERARGYIAMAQRKPKKEGFSLKTFDECCLAAVFKINEEDFQGALKVLDKALEFKTNEGRVYYLMADAHCRAGDTDNSLEFLKKAIHKDKMFSIMAQNELDFKSIWEDKKFKLITRLA